MLHAYVPGTLWSQSLEADVARVLSHHGAELPVPPVTVEQRNWNEAWEEKVMPVTVGEFRIRASWHRAGDSNTLKEIVIDPKMSFGTGHHETTRLVLRLLADVMEPGVSVLDAGSGTGVLAIGAALLGASSVLAFDTDRWSVENGTENIRRNGVEGVVTYRPGGIETARPGAYDVILANINRTTLCEMMGAFAEMLSRDGRVVLSGVLRSDVVPMISAIEVAGCYVELEMTEGEWWAAVVRPVSWPS